MVGTPEALLTLSVADDMCANGLKSPKPEEGREMVSWLEGLGQAPEDQRQPRNRPGLLVPVGPRERTPSLEVSWL